MEGKPLEDSPDFSPVVIPDGIYKAKVKAYRTNVHPQYGESLIIDFEITEGEHAGKIIGGFASWKKVTKKTKLYKWAVKLGAKVPTVIGETFDPDNLIGKEGRILTMQIQKIDRDGKPFFQSIVKDVLGAEGTPAPSSQQQPMTDKFSLLKQFQGKTFTEEDLHSVGFSDSEIQFLKSMGYIYEPKPGELKLISG